MQGRWNIDTFVLRELHSEFKVAKKTWYHATQEDAMRTLEIFVSCFEAILTSIATQEQRAFLLSNSKKSYREDIADSELSLFDYRLKVFMEVLRDPQHQETMLERAKEFLINVKKNRSSPRIVFSSSKIDHENDCPSKKYRIY